MSIVTRAGDDGTTALMYGRRVPKSHPRVEACGSVDELNAALGLAHAASSPALREHLEAIQKDLIVLMGELATAAEDLERYRRDGFSQVASPMTARLESLIHHLEGHTTPFRGWAMPGGNSVAAALDFARTVCRRAERRVCALHESGQVRNPEILVYLNRVSDLLWLMARGAERPG